MGMGAGDVVSDSGGGVFDVSSLSGTADSGAHFFLGRVELRCLICSLTALVAAVGVRDVFLAAASGGCGSNRRSALASSRSCKYSACMRQHSPSQFCAPSLHPSSVRLQRAFCTTFGCIYYL